MQQKLRITITVVVFLAISLLIIFLRKTPLVMVPAEFIYKVTAPVKDKIVSIVQSSKQTSQESIGSELKKLVDQKTLMSENSALRDQFETAASAKLRLLPAKVVGMPSFLPGVSVPEYIVIDKGERAGIARGQAVILKNMAVGKVVDVTAYVSKVQLIIGSSMLLTAKTSATQALGVVKGDGSNLFFDNVLLSETLKEGDVVVTKGDIDTSGKGFPPDIILGKIVAVEKKQSALFQLAKLKSLVEFPKLSTVFVVLGFE